MAIIIWVWNRDLKMNHICSFFYLPSLPDIKYLTCLKRYWFICFMQTARRRYRSVRGVVIVSSEAHLAGARRRLRGRVLRWCQWHHQQRRVTSQPRPHPLAPPRPRPSHAHTASSTLFASKLLFRCAFNIYKARLVLFGF